VTIDIELQSFCFASCHYHLPSLFVPAALPLTHRHPLSLHDALPICHSPPASDLRRTLPANSRRKRSRQPSRWGDLAPNAQRLARSEEHTSELQSRVDLVCRLLLEKKKKKQ